MRLFPSIPIFRRGQRITAASLNRMVEAINKAGAASSPALAAVLIRASKRVEVGVVATVEATGLDAEGFAAVDDVKYKVYSLFDEQSKTSDFEGVRYGRAFGSPARIRPAQVNDLCLLILKGGESDGNARAYDLMMLTEQFKVAECEPDPNAPGFAVRQPERSGPAGQPGDPVPPPTSPPPVTPPSDDFEPPPVVGGGTIA